MKWAGICLGASTVTGVLLETPPAGSGRYAVAGVERASHAGDPGRTLRDLLRSGLVPADAAVAVTGRGSRALCRLSSISEGEAVEQAHAFVQGERTPARAIVSAGGETSMVYVLDPKGRIVSVRTGNKCASGTGEFFLQQIKRLGLTLHEAVVMAQQATPHAVSGRCSVFCKSDCTHAANKGVPKADIVAGLCEMIAGKLADLLTEAEGESAMLVGGVSLNTAVVAALTRQVPGLRVPAEAAYFEALGAAVWATQNPTLPLPSSDESVVPARSSFVFLPRLQSSADMVETKQWSRGTARTGDECVVGLDVGSTTTKAMLVRTSDGAWLASEYLRTSGDPIEASRACYASLLRSLGGVSVHVVGLGVTGSGRKIAGLHAGTEMVINEIVAHAAAAVHFDPEVDTILEIGGQDAKYTFVVSGVPADYAMNEACSAGTGSFLEEAAKECLAVEMDAIADLALAGERPPSFNDQCAAFISSDIKSAAHEGIALPDILAGLVYSVCVNYANRVKGARPVGRRVFMQGGVCRNRAVPIAMAALLDKRIVVPPDPGLTGAFGVALETRARLTDGRLATGRYDLAELAARAVEHKDPFRCAGGPSGCDLGCTIAMVHMDGRSHPFGGACARYENLRQRQPEASVERNLVARRERLVGEDFLYRAPVGGRTVGVSRSFLANTYLPLFHNFFSSLGLGVVLPRRVDPEGVVQQKASFCFPAEIAHGLFKDLLRARPDAVFMPHLKGSYVENGIEVSKGCPLMQAEPFYLRSAFRKELADGRAQVLDPFLDFTHGPATQRDVFARVAKDLGFSLREGRQAFDRALADQHAMEAQMAALGRETLDALEAGEAPFAVVLFGRPYNAFVSEAHKGIPQKLASRGVTVLPYDFLPLADVDPVPGMYWSQGQSLLKAARLVKSHDRLFATFITSFSCGPDSFLLSHFRNIMGRKPALTLELDSHTADAGLETRIEAFLDVVAGYADLTRRNKIAEAPSAFRPARVTFSRGGPMVESSTGARLSLLDDRVRVVGPALGTHMSKAIEAVAAGLGIKGLALPPADEQALRLGRGLSTCKECLPLHATLGSLLEYVKGRDPREITVYFMPTGQGPCRFGQYQAFMRMMVDRLEIPNLALLSLDGANSYGGMGTRESLRAWRAIVISDVMEDIRSVILAAASDRAAALAVFQEAWDALLTGLTAGGGALDAALDEAARRLRAVRLDQPLASIPTVALTGELFVRRDGLSRRYLVERLADRGFAVRVAPTEEWLYYLNYLAANGLGESYLTLRSRLEVRVRDAFQRHYERGVKRRLARSGLYHLELADVPATVASGARFVSPQLTGETILSVGGPPLEIVRHACGVIAIGPFGCMPHRIAEAILAEAMTAESLISRGLHPGARRTLDEFPTLPFLAIETDGNPFPQTLEARLEAFCVQAKRLHAHLRGSAGGSSRAVPLPTPVPVES